MGHANVAMVAYDFSEQAEVNNRYFSRIRSCVQISIDQSGRITVRLKGRMLNPAWLESLAVTVTMSHDGKYICYAMVAGVREENDGYVLSTYPCEVSDTRHFPKKPLLEKKDWRIYLVSKNGRCELCIPNS